MSNHSAKFISAIFASILAGTSFAAAPGTGAQESGAPETATKTADNCLSAPKGAIPAGHHWHYRIEHPSKRQCWYSRAETDKAETGKTADTAPQDSTSAPPSQAASPSPAANPISPPQILFAPKSIADARAELTSPQMRVEDTNTNAEQRTGGAAPAASLPNSQAAIAPDAVPPSSHVASRWPDSSGAINSSNDPRLASAEPTASPQPNATTPVALAAADVSAEKQSASMRMLLLVMAGALALAGITASLVFRFARANAPQPEIRADRRAIWDQTRTERSSPSIFPNEDMPVWRSNAARDVPRDPRAPDDPERRVTEMLARLARSAQT